GQEPWLTHFNIVSAEAGSAADTTIATEWMRGSTAIGFPGGSFTMDFDTVYLLGSHKFGHERLSARVERFSTTAASHSVPDVARAPGHARKPRRTTLPRCVAFASQFLLSRLPRRFSPNPPSTFTASSPHVRSTPAASLHGSRAALDASIAVPRTSTIIAFSRSAWRRSARNGRRPRGST